MSAQRDAATNLKTPRLRVEKLDGFWGKRQVLRGIALDLYPGEITAILGANGAGKTSLMLALSGIGLTTRGSILMDDCAIQDWPSHLRTENGLVHCPEGRRVFARMSVEENLLLGAYLRRDMKAVRLDVERMYAQFSRLGERRRQLAGTLSGGEQQLLALARAAMGRPRVLLLDEPSLGLAPKMVEEVFAAIVQMAKDGLSVALVEQNAMQALSVAQNAVVLEMGAFTLRGSADALRSDIRVQQAYLGPSAQAAKR